MKQGGLCIDNSSPSAVDTPCCDKATVVTSNVTSKAQYSGPDVTTISDDNPEELEDVLVENQVEYVLTILLYYLVFCLFILTISFFSFLL